MRVIASFMIGYGTEPRSLGKQIRSWRGRMATTAEKHRPTIVFLAEARLCAGSMYFFTPNTEQMKNPSSWTWYFTRHRDAHTKLISRFDRNLPGVAFLEFFGNRASFNGLT